MATLASASIDVTKIDKTKLIDGKKGKYLPLTFSVNNEVDQFGNNVSIFISQTKEEREAKAPKTYLGNGKVVWTDGSNVNVPPREESIPTKTASLSTPVDGEDDLPF